MTFVLLPLTGAAQGWDVGGFARTVGVVSPVRVVGEGLHVGVVADARHRLMVERGDDAWAVQGHFIAGGIGGDVLGSARPPALLVPEWGPETLLRWPGLIAGGKTDGGHLGAHAFVDRLNVSWRKGALQLRVGRQPVNLATALMLSAHDVFVPFSPLAFFRAYKPGVDAVRLDWERLPEDDGGRVRVTLVGALGYRPDDLPSFAEQPVLDASGLVGKVVWGVGNVDIIGIIGQLMSRRFAGAGLQVDVDGWLWRGEALVQRPTSFGFEGLLATLSLQRFVSADLSLITEVMAKRGEFQLSSSPNLVPLGLLDPWGAGAAKGVQVLTAVNWQVHPLIAAQGLVWYSADFDRADDDTLVLGSYVTWSATDEVVLAVGGGVNLLNTALGYGTVEARWSW